MTIVEVFLKIVIPLLTGALSWFGRGWYEIARLRREKRKVRIEHKLQKQFNHKLPFWQRFSLKDKKLTGIRTKEHRVYQCNSSFEIKNLHK